MTRPCGTTTFLPFTTESISMSSIGSETKKRRTASYNRDHRSAMHTAVSSAFVQLSTDQLLHRQPAVPVSKYIRNLLRTGGCLLRVFALASQRRERFRSFTISTAGEGMFSRERHADPRAPWMRSVGPHVSPAAAAAEKAICVSTMETGAEKRLLITGPDRDQSRSEKRRCSVA